MTDRPILIDERDGPCEICRGWVDKKSHVIVGAPNGDGTHQPDKTLFRCDECGLDIKSPTAHGGHGWEGVQPHHFHIRPINGGRDGREGIKQELCLDCYIAHRCKLYPPGEPSPNGVPWPTAEEMLARHWASLGESERPREDRISLMGETRKAITTAGLSIAEKIAP